MRSSVASLRRMIKGKLQVEFVHQELTSYSGLELLRRSLRQQDLPRRLRAACTATGGGYRGGTFWRVTIAARPRVPCHTAVAHALGRYSEISAGVQCLASRGRAITGDTP